MVEKIRVATAARRDMLVIARTDARQSEGLEGSIARGKAYARAGADIVFCEALLGPDEMRLACDAIDRPMMANMANGGLTPILKGAELADIGYAFAIYPALTGLVAAASIETALHRLKDDGDGQPADVPMFDFKEFCGMIGFQEVWDFEKAWAR
jgi:2-methylisocitrate lyase-like PEP mutase family enzyme